MEEASFDVIITDMRMPGLDGRAFFERVERRWPQHTKHVVFVTGDLLASNLREFAWQHGRPVIEKPFIPSDVRRVVAEVARNGRRTS